MTSHDGAHAETPRAPAHAHIVWIVFATLGNVTKFATFHWPNLIVSDDAPLRALRHILIQYVPCSNSCGCAIKASAN